MFIWIFILTLSQVTKLGAFWYFTIGFLYVFASLVAVSISWSNIPKLIFPERPFRNYFYIITFIIVLFWLLFQHGDTETNPGPEKEKLKNLFFFCYWNVNSLIAQNLSKISLSETYNAIYKHDVLCISESSFYSSVLEGERNLQLIGYNMIRADHPSNSKQGGICIFFKEKLAVRVVNLSNLSECIIYEVLLVLHIDPRAKMLLSFKIFCQILKQF